jgi:RNA polymerase sigma-70 factor (ECF subfamily)
VFAKSRESCILEIIHLTRGLARFRNFGTSSSKDGAMQSLETQLLDSREKFLHYIQARISDPDLAEDILQESLLRALQSAPRLRNEERSIPWFYRILHNAVIDVYRHRQVELKAVQALGVDEPSVEPEDAAALCQCFYALIPALKPEYANLIRVELAGEDGEAVATRLGITPNNLKVRRHRARQALRKRLEETCRMCAQHGCLDCDCR